MSATAVIDAPPTKGTELALVDLSSIAYPVFLMSGAEPDPNAASTKIVERIRSLTAQHPHAAICCDAGKSFRAEIDPTYKAQREAAPEALHHQIRLAKEQLEADGYPVWSVKGFEADDLIASATAKALAIEGASVLIISADKDLLQLVGPRVRAKSVRDGSIVDSAAVFDKFGVHPSQMRDYLALVGDASDNIKGAKGIGPKTAAKLLAEYKSLDVVLYSAQGLTESINRSLTEFKERSEAVCKLITLRNDAPIPFEEIASERAPRDVAPMEDMSMEAEVVEAAAAAVVVGEVVAESAAAPKPEQNSAAAPTKPAAAKSVGIDIPASGLPAVIAAQPFERQLEPQSLGQAARLAEHMHTAKMFNGYGSPQSVLSTVLAGRELGLQAIASLRAFHVVDGKHALAADAMRGLVLRSGTAKYFRCTERTAERVTFETLRAGEPEPVKLSYTLAEARTAYGFGTDPNEKALQEREQKWLKSTWTKHPADMLAARASSKLARLVYADILFGLYAPEELTEGAA
jgi:5'-3' exonuclease